MSARALVTLTAMLVSVMPAVGINGCASRRPVNECTVTAETCRKSGCTGWVEVKFHASDTGEVLDPKVIRSCPPGYADDLALKRASGGNLPSVSWGREGVLRLHFSTELLPSGDIFEKAEGTWGWVAPFDSRYRDFIEEGCRKNPLTVHFSDDRSTMWLTQAHPSSVTQVELPTTGMVSAELRYRVINHTESTISVQLDDDNQKSASNPATLQWELRYSREYAPPEYLNWRRADWSSDSYDLSERCNRKPHFEAQPSSSRE